MKSTNERSANRKGGILPIFFSLAVMAALPFNARALNDALKIKIARSTYSDETVIRFLAGATTDFDGSYDAWKFFSSNAAVPNICTRIGIDPVTINTFPSFTASVTMDVYLKIGTAGTYSITAEEMGTFNSNVKIRLKDLVTGLTYDMRTTNTYTVSLPIISQTAAARFQVFFSYPAATQITNASCASCADGVLALTKAGETSWQYQVKDSTGTTVATGSASANTYTVTGLACRNYTVSISGTFSYTENRNIAVGVTPVLLGATFLDVIAKQYDNKVALTWSTAMESNAAYFTPEYSENGSDFLGFDQVAAAGTSSSKHTYKVTREDVTAGESYYRIKLTDMDGAVTYSPITRVSANGEVAFEAYPVPASETLSLRMDGFNDQKVILVMYDLSGNRVWSMDPVSNDRIELAIPSVIAQGTYVMKAIGETQYAQQMIIIQ